MPFDETSRVAGRIRVLLPLPLAGAYDYLSAGADPPRPGDFVRVPLGRRHVIGVVWDGAPAQDVPDERLKNVSGRCEVPPLAEPMRRFIDWVAAYTLTPPGAVLRMAMSVPEALEPPRMLTAVALSES